MASVFTPRANLIARASLAGLVAALAAAAVFAYGYAHSPYSTGVGIEIDQPVPFSHEHHVAGLGIDCRYCHTSVEDSAFAGMPATQTCMHCHAKVWTDAAMLAPVRESWRREVPIRWRRVHDLPGFVYFDHSIHVAKGIGCVTCHGRVDQMRLMRKAETLHMRWCLDCHRNPEPHVRPVDKVFDLAWQRPDDAAPPEEPPERPATLTDCSACHR